MTLLDFIPSIDNIVGGLIGAFTGWFFTRKKQQADTTTIEIDNGSKLVGIYKEALDDLPPRYEEKYKHVQEMATAVEKLFEKKEQILMQEIEYQKKQVALYKKMYDEKVKEFNKYKKEHP